MASKYSYWSSSWIFHSLFFVLLIINFIIDFLRISYFAWHLFLHFCIIFFGFLVLFYSLELPSKSVRWIVLGVLFWVVIESILFLSHVFEYKFFENNIFLFLGSVVGLFMMLKGFGGAVNNG